MNVPVQTLQSADDADDALQNLTAMIHACEFGGLSDAPDEIHACYFRVMREQVEICQKAVDVLYRAAKGNMD